MAYSIGYELKLKTIILNKVPAIGEIYCYILSFVLATAWHKAGNFVGIQKRFKPELKVAESLKRVWSRDRRRGEGIKQQKPSKFP